VSRRTVGWATAAALVVGLVVAMAVTGGSGPDTLSVRTAGGTDAAGLARGASEQGVEYRVAGELPDLPDRARAWELGQEAGADDVAALASILDLPGEVKAEVGGWTVADGARRLRADPLPGRPWRYTTGSPDGVVCVGVLPGGPATASPGGVGPGPVAPPVPPSACPSFPAPVVGAPLPCPAGQTCPPPPARGTAVDPSGGGSGTAGGEGCPMPRCPPGQACPQVCGPPEPEPAPAPEPRPADLPSRDEAEAVARALLGRTGLDLDGAAVTVAGGVTSWPVNVEPTVGGFPVRGWTWSVVVGPNGRIESAGGWLARPEAGDEYPLVGVEAGVERLKSAWGGPVPLGAEPAVGRLEPACPPGADCPAPAPTVRTITGVRLGLMFGPFSGDRPELALLVPAYLFRTDDGATLPVVAVEDRYLPEPTPSAPGEVPPESVPPWAPPVTASPPSSAPASSESSPGLPL
jgi:hypothetical protein